MINCLSAIAAKRVRRAFSVLRLFRNLSSETPLRNADLINLDSRNRRAPIVAQSFFSIRTYMSSKGIVSLIMEFFWVLVFLVLLIYSTDQTNGRCEQVLDLQHATVNYRARSFVRIRCHRGYSPQGVMIKACDQSGLLRGEKPFCASEWK